jgi:hypothetical protein
MGEIVEDFVGAEEAEEGVNGEVKIEDEVSGGQSTRTSARKLVLGETVPDWAVSLNQKVGQDEFDSQVSLIALETRKDENEVEAFEKVVGWNEGRITEKSISGEFLWALVPSVVLCFGLSMIWRLFGANSSWFGL